MSDDLDVPATAAGQLLAQIDAEQDELLRNLDQLNARLDSLLRDCAPPKPEPADDLLPAFLRQAG